VLVYVLVSLDCSQFRTHIRNYEQAFGIQNRKAEVGLLQSPLDAVLGSMSKVKLLRILLPLDRPVALREAARMAGISASGAQAALGELTAMGIIDHREATSQHLYRVNRKNHLAAPLSALFNAEDERWSDLLAALENELYGGLFGPSIEAAAIFGSSARGDDRPDSDLDLLVVTESDDEDDDVWERLLDKQPVFQREFGVRLSPVVMSLDRLRQRAEDGDPLIAEVIKDGITVVKPSIEKLLR
jgi:hypothetical protein